MDKKVKDAVLKQLGRVGGFVDAGRWTSPKGKGMVMEELQDPLAELRTQDNMPRREYAVKNIGRAIYWAQRKDKERTKRFTAAAIEQVSKEDYAEGTPVEPPPPPPPPEEEKEPPPPPPSGEKPFLDMKVVRDWHGTNANSGDVTDVADGIQLRVPNDHEAGSNSGNPRAELLTAGQFTNGDELWLHSRVWLSSGVPSGWMTLMSFFNGGGQIAPWHISCVGGKFGWQTPPGPMAWSEPVTTGAWIDLLHHHKFGTGVQLETWLKIEGKDPDWRPVWDAADGLTNTWTSGNNQSPNYYKDCVYYMKGSAPGGVYTAKFGRTMLGKTRASVGA